MFQIIPRVKFVNWGYLILMRFGDRFFVCYWRTNKRVRVTEKLADNYRNDWFTPGNRENRKGNVNLYGADISSIDVHSLYVTQPVELRRGISPNCTTKTTLIRVKPLSRQQFINT